MKENENSNLIDEILKKNNFSEEEQILFWECLQIIQERKMENQYDIENEISSRIKEVIKQ